MSWQKISFVRCFVRRQKGDNYWLVYFFSGVIFPCSWSRWIAHWYNVTFSFAKEQTNSSRKKLSLWLVPSHPSSLKSPRLTVFQICFQIWYQLTLKKNVFTDTRNELDFSFMKCVSKKRKRKTLGFSASADRLSIPKKNYL